MKKKMRVKKDVLLELKNLKPIIAKYKYFYEDAVLYVEKIRDEFTKIENSIFREKSKFDRHKQYGEYIHTYKANAHTHWYIIYDISPNGDIWINKIINNHMTVNGISGLPGTRNNNILKTLLIAAGIYALYKISSK